MTDAVSLPMVWAMWAYCVLFRLVKHLFIDFVACKDQAWKKPMIVKCVNERTFVEMFSCFMFINHNMYMLCQFS